MYDPELTVAINNKLLNQLPSLQNKFADYIFIRLMKIFSSNEANYEFKIFISTPSIPKSFIREKEKKIVIS